ncbi:MAG: hypothetical protein J3R72DRAFT_213059 [Linnemannia gamsii]|nr:MAG: hypothetical protein J3R72DRAFT_213059 [Linnemannia gamsii]
MLTRTPYIRRGCFISRKAFSMLPFLSHFLSVLTVPPVPPIALWPLAENENEREAYIRHSASKPHAPQSTAMRQPSEDRKPVNCLSPFLLVSFPY